MALLGTLKGFGVTEIFQLISQQMKTGSLILSSPKATVTIAFNNGIIEGVTSDQWDTDPRAEVLLQGHIISLSDYKIATDHHRKKTAQPWHEVLAAQGRLKPTLFQKATDVVIKGILLDIFQWGEGSYRFEDWDMQTEGMITCHIPTESIILNTLRMIDEWPIIKQKIPPADYCPVTIMPVTQKIVRSADLGEVDLQIFDLIDGSKTIEAIVRQSLETPADALSAFVRLIDANLVEVFPLGTRESRDLITARHIMWARFKRSLAYILLAACISTLALAGRPSLPLRELRGPVIREPLIRQQELAREYARQEIGLSSLDTESSAR